MYSGNYVLILHTHLPWVLHHGDWPHGVDWLLEAVAECYIPLLNVFNELLEENIIPKVTLDISPILCEQLAHKDLIPAFNKYCKTKIKLAELDEKNFRNWGFDEHQIYLAQYWQKWYFDRLNDFSNKYNSSIIDGLKKLQDIGAIEIMTCGATHGYLPLLGSDNSVNLQIKLAVENYKKFFNRQPRGIWLPECAYRPSYNWKSLLPIHPFHIPKLRQGIEQMLSKYGLEYFVTDQSLTERATALGHFIDADKEKFVSINSPDFKPSPWNFDKSPMSLFNVCSSEKTEYGTAVAFTRHQDISMQVWSGEVGYPGEPNYLDFHKKQFESKLRYWRVTDTKTDMMYKQLYHPDWIMNKIDNQSNHFIHQIENTSNWYKEKTGKIATLCTPFDTELFGHWWYEGPLFIKAVLRGLHFSPWVNSATASEQIFRIKPKDVMLLPEGSWGENNNHDVWSNKENKWTWEMLYNDENTLKSLYEKYPEEKQTPIMKRILLQIVREMLLLQSSDWQFLIHTRSARDYSEQRFFYHHSDFNNLSILIDKVANSGVLTKKEEAYLAETEKRNSVFNELQTQWWKE